MTEPTPIPADCPHCNAPTEANTYKEGDAIVCMTCGKEIHPEDAPQ
jgi:hypothetical protein